MKRVLTVGLKYTGAPIQGVQFDNLGLCKADINKDKSAFSLYEYDVIVINPASYSHFLFGEEGPHSNSVTELGDLKRENNLYDIDTAFDKEDRENEMLAALQNGATVVWCFAEAKRMNFFGYRKTWMGYIASPIARLVNNGDLLVKKSRRLVNEDPNQPFFRYFAELSKSGWSLCLRDSDLTGYVSVASTPEGYTLGGKVSIGGLNGWLVTPPTSEESANRLILDAVNVEKNSPNQEKYHGIFLSHTGKDKPFVRQLRKDLMASGVTRVWVDEAEIEIGDSLIDKITQGMQETKYIGIVLSNKSINAPWVRKELDIALNREIAGGESIVLPILYEKCDLPTFLQGKLYADFTTEEDYESSLDKLLRKLRIK
ncbi:toll/interleukin-1 receptor domain-containing protein [Pseudomonas nitroreducens]|uniref:toll/interleukin-1 receptor domain-containing protein n=1 Tax=Pseudomonas nitroreducens TaxID=46680 RepID=UPI001CA8752B|nr:toll/interleukin-1 receptor domain-containing protein [Pseudomonas nitritireducens]